MMGFLSLALLTLMAAVTPLLGQSGSRNKEALEDWIKGEVRYLITEEERSVYDRLTTLEERERFIEEFWRRRDPDPQTSENEFREEFYRRIAYANENFGAGMAGWLTDRGRIYVLYGPPTRRDPYPMGGRYQKAANQGGDTITTFPFEIWEYDYIPGIGQDLTIEFVDRSGSGLYTLELDPNKKDVFYWRRGENPQQRVWARAKEVPFERLRVWSKFQAPPQLKYPQLREEVQAEVGFAALPFDIGSDYVRMSDDLYAVPLTLSVPNSTLMYEGRDGVFQADVQWYVAVTNLSGRLVYQFDDAFASRSGGVPFQEFVKRRTFHQRIVPLAPGRYKIRVALKDARSGKLGTLDTTLWIPQPSDGGLNTSSLICADVIQPVAEAGRGEEFVLGPLKVIPNIRASYAGRHRLGLYLEAYDLATDSATGKPSVEISYWLESSDGVRHPVENNLESRFPEGSTLAVSKAIPLDDFQPGKYRILVRVTDQLTQRIVTLDRALEIR